MTYIYVSYSQSRFNFYVMSTPIYVLYFDRDQLSFLIALTSGHHEDAEGLKPKLSSRRPKFYRSNTEPLRQVDDSDQQETSTDTHNRDTAFANLAYISEEDKTNISD